jgi:heat shock protein HtpX
MGNQLKTALLLGILTCLIVWIGNATGGQNGMMVAFAVALCMNLFSYWFSDRIVLSLYGAQQATENQAPELFAIVRKLCSAAGLPMPKIYIIPSDSPNAFATGRNPEHAAVAVTSGILRLLSREELEGVIAHEVSHISNGDMVTMTLLQGVINAIVMFLARVIAFAVTSRRDGDRDSSPLMRYVITVILEIALSFLGMIVLAWFSRFREFKADEGGAKLAGKEKMIAALERLKRTIERADLTQVESVKAFKISSKSSFFHLFATHPPLEDRINRLKELY